MVCAPGEQAWTAFRADTNVWAHPTWPSNAQFCLQPAGDAYLVGFWAPGSLGEEQQTQLPSSPIGIAQAGLQMTQLLI